MHAMDETWCYLCRIDGSGLPSTAAWGLDVQDDTEGTPLRTGPMTRAQRQYLRFLCHEFSCEFDPYLTQDEAGLVIESFLADPMSSDQSKTLVELSQRAGVPMDADLTYGAARTKIRRLVAMRGLKSA
jgi:hypothetical protein